MPVNVRNKLINKRTRNYLVKDLDDFRLELLNYARTYFPDKIQDFSETSSGGMLLDFASIVGDTLSFYLDHQFNELDPNSSIEIDNILRHIRSAGINSSSPSPSSVYVTFYFRADIDTSEYLTSNVVKPLPRQLIKLLKGTSVETDDGIPFSLIEDVDFSIDNYDVKEVTEYDDNGNPTKVVLGKKGLCVSGTTVSEFFDFGESSSFATITLENEDVTSLIKVIDSDNNEYYEVEFLTQDTVYTVVNHDLDNESSLELTPAPYRFIREDDISLGTTKLRFGSGTSLTLQDDIIVDPSDSSIPLYGRNYINRFSLDPSRLLDTNTLGISPRNTSVEVKYRYGGGISHNVSARSINNISSIELSEPVGSINSEIDQIVSSLAVRNDDPATGGEDALSIEELKGMIQPYKKMQSRIVTKEDLLARIYSMPSEIGKVFRASIKSNKYSSYSKNLHIVTRDINKKLTYASDALKRNLSTYINEFRIIGDAYNILDAPIINFGIEFTIRANHGEVVSDVILRVINRLINIMRFDTFQIDQQINLHEISNVILNTEGVRSLNTNIDDLVFIKTGTEIDSDTLEERSYSESSINIKDRLSNGMISPIDGGIFELKYARFDIIGNST